jgi:hypothetical protein
METCPTRQNTQGEAQNDGEQETSFHQVSYKGRLKTYKDIAYKILIG